MRIRALLNRTWLRCLVIAGLGFVVRMPALQGLPIWDDEYLIGENPFIKSPLLFPEAFRHFLFLDGFSAHYRPMQNVSLGIDYLLWNSNPWGYHLTNVVLHIASGLLLYFLLQRLFPLYLKLRTNWSSSAAFIVALLWTVHPVHSAAVDYISGRADSLSFSLAVGAWLLCLQARKVSRANPRACYFLAAVCGLLALCAREIAGIWLILFLLHRCCLETSLSRKSKIIAVSCCLLLFGSYAGLHLLPEARAAHISVDAQSNSPPLRAVLMLRALGDYTRLMVFPTTLSMERTILQVKNYPSQASWRDSVATEYLSILGALVLTTFIYGASRKGRGQAMRLFGALWFLVAYLPISNLFDLNATVAEHWLYLPAVGFLIFFCGVVADLSPRLQKGALALSCLFLLALSARSYVRSTDWVTPKTFYQRTMAAGPTSGRIAVRLGLIYSSEGNYAKAEALYRGVLELWPDYPVARNNLADVLYRQGKRAEGEALLNVSQTAAAETRQEYPHTWAAALSLSRLRYLDHDNENALAILERARADYPDIWEIIRFESEILRETKGPDAALRLVAEFTRDNWWHHGANVSLGKLLWERGDQDGAMSTFRFASWLDVHEVEALNLLVAMDLQQNQLEDARVVQERAVSRQPDEPRQYLLLADILQRMNRTEEAARARAHVEQLQALTHVAVAKN